MVFPKHLWNGQCWSGENNVLFVCADSKLAISASKLAFKMADTTWRKHSITPDLDETPARRVSRNAKNESEIFLGNSKKNCLIATGERKRHSSEPIKFRIWGVPVMPKRNPKLLQAAPKRNRGMQDQWSNGMKIGIFIQSQISKSVINQKKIRKINLLHFTIFSFPKFPPWNFVFVFTDFVWDFMKTLIFISRLIIFLPSLGLFSRHL